LPSARFESVMVVAGQPDEKRFWKCTMSWNMFLRGEGKWVRLSGVQGQVSVRMHGVRVSACDERDARGEGRSKGGKGRAGARGKSCSSHVVV